jgi:hypothetical protein
MKTNKNGNEVLVKVLGVTIKCKFRELSKEYISNIPIEIAELCYAKALK